MRTSYIWLARPTASCARRGNFSNFKGRACLPFILRINPHSLPLSLTLSHSLSLSLSLITHTNLITTYKLI